MKKSDQTHPRFENRPSVAFIPTRNSSITRQKRKFSAAETPKEEFLKFKDFKHTIKDSRHSESRNSSFSKEFRRKKANKNNSNGTLLTQPEEDHLSKVLAKEYSSMHISSLGDIITNEISKDYLEYTYIVSIYTMNNYFGARSSASEGPQELLVFINKLLQLPSKIKNELFKRAKGTKSIDYSLNVNIIEAVNLISTDPDGLSDPFCKIWMNNRKEDLKETSIKENTLNPTWKESFCFEISNLVKDIIHIEVWDKDPRGFTANLKEIRRMRGIRGFWMFCRDCCQNACSCHEGVVDDFIGKIDVSIKDVYSEGIDDWTALKSMAGESIGGKLHFSAEFVVVRTKYILNVLKRHLLLLKVCLLQSLNEYKYSLNGISCWEQIFSPAALSLIFQHRVQSSLTLAEDVLCRFIVFVHLMQKQPLINYAFLFRIIDDTYECMQQLLSKEFGLESSLEDLYRNAVNNVYDICISIIKEMHSLDLVGDKSKCLEFEYVLKCVIVCHDISGKEGFPLTAVKSEATNWFAQIAEEIKNIDPKTRSHFLVKTLSFIVAYHTVADKVMKNVFPDRSYTSLTYDIIDFVLSESLESQIAKIAEDTMTVTGEAKDRKIRDALDVFLKLKELDEYICKEIEVSHCKLKITNFRDWFGLTAIVDWFKCKQEIIVSQIMQIISTDSLENKLTECAGRLEKQSLSVKLTTSLIQKELVYMWNIIYHPDYPKLNSVFVETLHLSCMKYAEYLINQIQSRNIASRFRIDGKNMLSVIANNLWSLAIFVKKIISDTVNNLPPDCHDTTFCLKLTCCVICADISKELEPDIVNEIKKVVCAGTRKKQSIAITTYVKTVNNLLKDAMTTMAFEVYLLFMRQTWTSIIKAVNFYKELHKDSDTSSFSSFMRICMPKPNILAALLDILTETEKLCFIDDKGKLKKFIWTDDFRALKNDLQKSVVQC